MLTSRRMDRRGALHNLSQDDWPCFPNDALALSIFLQIMMFMVILMVLVMLMIRMITICFNMIGPASLMMLCC